MRELFGKLLYVLFLLFGVWWFLNSATFSNAIFGNAQITSWLITLIGGISGAGLILLGAIRVGRGVGERIAWRRDVDRASRNLTLRQLIDLYPREFELALCALFERQGYKVQHTGRGGDGGVDIRLTKDGLTFIAQCKRYALDRAVSVSEVRDFYGALASEPAARGYFITTSRFTKAAADFARDKQTLTLWDGDNLKQMLAPNHPTT